MTGRFVIVQSLSRNSFELVTAQACCFFSDVDPLSFTLCYRSTLPDCARYSSLTRFFLHGVMTPSDKSVGPGF